MPDTIGFAVIGADNIGKIHMTAILRVDRARAVVVCAPNEVGGRTAAEAYSPEWVAEFGSAVARDDVDVVAICTPTDTHMWISLAAQAGIYHSAATAQSVTLPFDEA